MTRPYRRSRSYWRAEVDATSWAAFLADKTEPAYEGHDRQNGVRVNGRLFVDGDTWRPSLSNWRRPRRRGVSFWSADAFCVHVGLEVDDFFRWARARELPGWAYGPPKWDADSEVVEDFPGEVRRFLEPRLRQGIPFAFAWAACMRALRPRARGWTERVCFRGTEADQTPDPDLWRGCDPTPLEVLESAMRREYERRLRELRGRVAA